MGKNSENLQLKQVSNSESRSTLANILLVAGVISVGFGIAGILRPLGTSVNAEAFRGLLTGLELGLGVICIYLSIRKRRIKK